MAHLLGYCFKFLTLLPVKEQLTQRLKSYETRARELEVIVEKLKKKRDAIQRTVNEERRLDREIVDEVKEWIEKANMLFDEYEIFNEDKICHEYAVFELFKSGYLPKPGIRYRRSITVDDLTRKANELLQKAKFDTFSYWSGPPSMAAFFSNVGYVSFQSREETMRKILEELEKPSVRMIGLHGLSGVGKTTLVKEVVKKAWEDKMFDAVTMANVTRNPDIRKIQGQIVDMLGVVLNEESDIARAARIHKILKNEKNSTLIILDDLQEKLDFNMLGIPYEIDNDDGLKDDKGKSFNIDDLKKVKDGKSLNSDGLKNVKEGKSVNPDGLKNDKGKSPIGHRSDPSDKVNPEATLSQYNGCKILMISESRRVLLSQMEGKSKSIFSVEVLKEKEPEILFKKMAGIDDKNEFVKLAAQIANKCNGLPMSIVTTARALKNQSRSVWEDLHRQLERQNLTGAREFSTKLSYDLLEDEELKYTFLLCAHMGHHALIMDLVKYCIGLGFLRGIYTVRETRDRVYAMVVKLKESGLLSDDYSSDQFTMQDTVRGAALSIAYKENHLFTMTKGRIDDWPDKLERYDAISLHHCDFIEGFLKKRSYPRLKLFEVNNNDPKLEIATNFFKGMKELKVLILTGIRLSLLKLSISSLTELRMLCLEQCVLDKDLSFIGKLKRLRILSFSGSDIENLPVELKQLNKLQIFDISNCSRLNKIPSGVISSLVSLEELYMRNTLIQWEAEEHTDQSDKASLSELEHLNQLTTLDLQIPNVYLLPKNLFFDKLHNYNLVVGDSTAYLETDFKMPEKYETVKFLAIRLKDGFDIHSLMGIKMLFERVENLFLEELNVVQDIFYTLNLKGFPYLKHLWIKNNSIIQSLIHPEDRERPEKAFPKLESLYLYNLENMDKLCSCELSEPSFGKLKVIKINLCGKLKNVFSLSVVRLLTLLETVEVSECEALKNIVPVERQSNSNEIELLNFPELRFLKLQSLSDFIGLYPIEEKKELFHEKVEVSKLERIELSSIPIEIIWRESSNQPSLRSFFQNLIHLDVNGCGELKYLISFTMAKNLVSLQSLFVSECEKMRSIFPLEQDGHHKIKGSIFPKLKNIKLHSMKSLSDIWNSKLPLDSFNKLDTLIIEECDKLVNIFPCYMEGMFRSLCNLRVTNCRSIQAIFDLDDKRDFGRGYLSNLQDVHLEALPKLKQVWILNEDRGGILNMNNLQKIWFQECNSLENIFPFSVANKCHHNLEYLVVCDCLKLREIVAKGEAPHTGSDDLDPSFKFLKLSTIKLSALPKLRSFYPGACGLVFPTLNDLSIELCDNLEPFNKEEPSTDPQRKLVLFDDKVINKLKSMQIESRHAKSPSSYMGKGNHRRDDLEELCLSRLMDTEILYSFLHRNPNLISLSLNNCSFEEIVPRKEDTKIVNIGVVPKLKTLKLVDLPKLKEINFEPDIILKRIEFLILQNCPCIMTVVPSSVSLTHLTNLEVVSCDGLKTLMSASTAKSLGQLNTMKVIKCESLMEIVAKGENAGKIVFKQLKALELVSLENLKSFCSSDNCDFEFPSLEKLVVSACYNMEQFSEKVTSTPILQNIYVLHEKQKKRCRWEGDLNATIQKIFNEKKFFEDIAEMSFSKHPELRQAWQGEVDLQNNWFYSLKILKLENCEIRPCAIPSNVLPYLKSLKELQVRDCDNVEVIFDMNVTEGTGIGTTLQLQKLTLQRLPKLMHVWKRIGKETKTFQNLQLLFVGECHKLQTVFPAAVAKNLKKLNHLEVEYCDGLLQIVGKEEDAAARITQKFAFPCLTTLDLQCLSELIYFYPESFTLECPLLNKLHVLMCPKFVLFESAFKQLFSSDLNDISNLERLSLGWKLMYSWVLKSRSGELMGYLKYLNDIQLCFNIDESQEPILPIEILQTAPNLIKMSVCCCHCLKLFRIQIPKLDENRMLTHLKILTLKSVSKLQSIGSEDSPWLNVICDQLHEFYLYNSPDLTRLVDSTSAVSFSYLKELFISGCNGLEYLFTPSAANKLMQLEHIEVWECESLKQIVAEEQDDTTLGGIRLELLYRIDLNNLSSLECFYSGNDTLQLPSLIQVDIWKCPNMEIFCQGSITADSFRGIQASIDSNDELILSNDVNSSVKEVFLQWGFFYAVDDDYFSENLFGKVGLQNKWLCNLVTLNLDSCTLSYAIPSSILPCLNNLQELQVQDSDKVEVIFDMNENEIMVTTSQLKKLTLQQLSNLVNVWEKNHPGVLIFQNLQEVIVNDCENLQTLFPTSLAKNLEKLEKLDVESCHELKEIVEKEESTAADITEKFVFPCLEKLHLCDLPEVTCFYPQTFTLECPSLNSLFVSDCHKFELFQCEHPMNESTSINRQPLISNLKVISKLKELKLDWKHISSSTLRLRSELFVEGLNYLQKIFLYFDADEDEQATLPIEILQKAPNLTEMSIYHCNVPEILFTQNSKIVEDRMLGELKILTLWKVSTLQSMDLEDSSWLNTIYENLQELNVWECPDLTTLVHTVSFSCLKKVFISQCPKLQYLFTPSAAKKLMNLEEITVKECELVKEIVMTDEGDVTNEAIKFVQLKTIVLHSLPSLVCFYSGSDTLQLSSLVDVHVWECPDMKIFCKGVIYAESFRGIQMSLDAEEDLLFHQDLNATVKDVFQRQGFLKAVDEECFSDNPELQANRHGNIGQQNKWLSNLVTLKLYKCTLPYAIPSSILPYLNNLEQLQVRDSDKVEVIFDMNDTEILETTSKLKILTLEGLLKLTRVWEKNSEGVLIFQNLEEVLVRDCGNLQSLFPASLAKNVEKLQKLQIISCHKLQEIFEKEEGTAANVIEKFVFSHLKVLNLRDLPRVTYFYPQTFALEWPSLNRLYVSGCHKLELFQSAHPVGESTPIIRHPLISNLNVLSNLKDLLLDWKHISALHFSFESEQFTEGLKDLKKITLRFDAVGDEKPILAIEMLQKAPNLIHMGIERSRSTGIFLAENPKIGEDRMLGQLKTLALRNVSMLQSIVLEESSWLNTICEKLHELNFFQCPHLTTLVRSTSRVSFSCLKKVSISNCHKLQYLFTSSTAKKLMNLEEITVKECKSVEKIVAKEVGTTSEAIQFERLNTIVLHSLPTLTCFYSGNDTLHISSLINVHVRECPNMQIFSRGVIDAESFQGIQMSSDPKEDLLFHQDLNATIKGMFPRQEFLKAVDEECLSDNPELQANWHGKVGLQNKWLRNLVTLKLNNCTLQYAIPSAILPHLNNLKELKVRDSKKVEAIFDMNDIEILETTSQLKILTLKRLSKVKRVWENNIQGVLFFRNLKDIVVCDCINLQTLFPACLAKNLKKLKKLEIESCHELQGIVEKEEGTAANKTEKFVFPCLEKLHLYDLPQLTCFYPQTFTLECPALNELSVFDCPELELFQSVHPNGEVEAGCISINRQPLISNLKVISNMKELILDWKHIFPLSLRFRSEQFAECLNILEEISLFFDTDENEKPMLPIEILQKAPNLIKMKIRCCNSPEIFLVQNHKIGEDRMLGQLKVLELWKVSALQSMESEDSWLNTICEKLHELNVDQCAHLKTVAHTVSFSCLKKVSISSCLKLQYLFTSSAAKKLIYLEHMEVRDCKSIKEIVAKEQDETTSGEINLERLYSLDLDCLSSLECFYSGNDTLQLPSLIQVDILKCPKMEIFSRGLIHASSFKGIQASSDSDDELVLYNDVNSSIKKVFLQQDHLVFGDSYMLREIWLKPETLPDWYFCNLTSMVMEGCDSLSNAILPSHLLPFLSNLEKLQVRKCNSLKAIFSHTKIISMGPRPQGSLSLPILKELHVENCEELEAIVEKDAADIEEANKELSIFSTITLLRLLNLPNLRCIYPGMHILEWGMLEELHVKHCQKLKFFAIEFQNSADLHPDGQDKLSTNQQAIVSLKRVTPCMEVMSLGKEEARMIEHGELCIDLPKLNSLKLQCFHDEFDVFPFVFGSNVSLPIPSIERLELLHSAFKEIFPSQTPGIDFTEILSELKELELQSLFQLESIGLEHSWISPILENLETLLVRGCHCLTELTPSTVSFCNLIKLTVKDCRGLKYLFTFSTAKTLVALKEMHIIKCKSLKRIVAKDGEEEDDDDEDNIMEEEGEGDEDEDEDEDEDGDKDEDEDKDENKDEDEDEDKDGDEDGDGDGDGGESKDELIFNKLETLTLRSLPKLRNFYTGSSTLSFPSLKVLLFRKCYLKPFRLHDKFVPKKLEVITDEFGTTRGINSVIMKQGEEEASFLS